MALSIKSLAFRTESCEEWIFWSGINCMSLWKWFAREKVFRNSSGYGFNVSFVNCMSVFVESVLQASLSFTRILQITTVTQLNNVDHFCSVTSYVWSNGACFTCSVKSITCKAQPRSQGPLSFRRPPLRFDYEVHWGEKKLKNSSARTAKRLFKLDMFSYFHSAHWKRNVSKEPFHFILETTYDDSSSILWIIDVLDRCASIFLVSAVLLDACSLSNIAIHKNTKQKNLSTKYTADLFSCI